MTPAVAAHGLRKDFGQIRALDDIDLEVPRGSVFGVIGHNGAGKTTLMRILLDIVRPTSGTASVLGQDPRQEGAALRKRVGYLPGELRLNPKMSGRDHLRFWASLSDDPPHVLARAHSLAGELDVRLGDPTRKLSKGNKQKLGVIQAFMHGPELVILDEPTSGLDPLVQQQVLDLIKRARDAGATIFLSSHVMSEVEHVADTAAVLSHGRIVSVAPMNELRATAARRVRAIVADHVSEAEAVLRRYNLDLETAAYRPGEVAITGVLEGKSNELVRALAQLDLISLVVAEPDLEERVLDMYGVSGANRGTL